jgi:YegS/Rv2252/BmrU family lipid kinase
LNAPYERIHVIINPASGRDEPILNTMNDIFKEYGIDWDASITKALGDGAAHAKEAIDKGAQAILAYGGDGTQLDVAGGMVNTGIPMGILPGGTANALADDLGLPNTLPEALRLICEPHKIRPIDVGQVADRHFLLRMGTGVIGSFSEAVTREMKDRYGIAAYIIGSLQAIREPKNTRYKLKLDGEEVETEGVVCMVSNAIGALGIRLAPEIKIDDGLLDVYVLNIDVQTALAIAGSISGRENAPLQHWQASHVEIIADPIQKIYADGEEESAAETPCVVKALAGALHVIVRPDEDAEE